MDYFLQYYIDEASWFVGTKEEKEAKRFLKSLIKFFGKSDFSEDHRAGAKMKFVFNMVKEMGAKNALQVVKSLKDKPLN